MHDHPDASRELARAGGGFGRSIQSTAGSPRCAPAAHGGGSPLTVRITFLGWKPSTRTGGNGSNVETDGREELLRLGTVRVPIGRIGGGQLSWRRKACQSCKSSEQADGSRERSRRMCRRLAEEGVESTSVALAKTGQIGLAG